MVGSLVDSDADIGVGDPVGSGVGALVEVESTATTNHATSEPCAACMVQRAGWGGFVYVVCVCGRGWMVSG